jgi:hypothetical protein
MDGKVYRIALDLKKNLVTNVETLVQNDKNTSSFEIELFNDGKKIMIDEKDKLEVAVKKADGTVVVDEAKNNITHALWSLSEQVLTCAGYVLAELRILNAADVLTASQSFKFLVRPNNLNDETIKSTSQYRALDEAVKKAEALEKELQGVPEQVASMKADLEAAKTTLDNTQKELLAGLDLSNKNIAEIKAYLAGVNAEIEKLKEKDVDIANLKALLQNLEDLKTRLANLEATLADAKSTDESLKINIATGNKTSASLQSATSTAKSTQTSLQEKTAQGLEVNKSLGQSIKTGQGIVSSINAADKGLADKIATADTSKTNLDKSINTANKSKSDLDASKTKADNTKTALDSSNSTATTNKAALDESIGKAETTKANLDASKVQADSTKTALDKSIKTGQEVNAASETNKTNLDQSIKDAKDAKVQLDESTDKANAAKSSVDASTATADAKNTELISTTSTATSTDDAAKKTIAQLQALLSQSGTTEQNLKDIIASGNLDKYVTDPKLQEALKDYVTSADLVTKLDSKVDKVTGKTLTSNDFTNAYKSKLDDLTKITKVSQLTNDSNYITDLKMQEALSKIKTLKKEVVNQLPTTGQDDIIYLIKDAKGKTKNIYLEYLWINNDFELIGSTQVDLTGYAKTSEVDSKLSGKVDKESGKALSSNDYTSAEKTKLSSINPSDYAKQSDISSAKAKSNKNNINVFTDRSTSYTSLDIILGDLELRTEQNRDNKANKTDIKTKLSEMIDDSTHRTVTDTEKSTWDNKLSSVSGVDISRSKTKGYNTSSTWQPLSTNRDLEDWIGDFDKRTRENRQENLSVIASNPDSDGKYKTVEYKRKDGTLLFKTELIGTAPKYSQVKLTTYENGSATGTYTWNLTYDANDFVCRKELI